jgi:dethiobiotin synthetase/adenosylmethionine--8-amino-7-oxononanoate aminotransferase
MEDKPVSDEQVRTALDRHLDGLMMTTTSATSTRSSIWIETAGGVLSPSSSSPDNHSAHHAKNKGGWGWRTQGDLYRYLRDRASVVLVGDGRLGGISVTLATLEALLNRDYHVSGILLLQNDDENYDEDTNQRALQEYVTSYAAATFSPTSSSSSSPLFLDPETSIRSLPRLPPEPEPLTDWYASEEVKRITSSFVHDHLLPSWQIWQNEQHKME